MPDSTYNGLIDNLLNIPKFGSGIGLHRMQWLCTELAQTEWWSNLNAIKVTGSNGKGSVCAMAASIFEALGITFGLYTSPHLLKFNERIHVNGHNITDGQLSASVDWFLEKRDAYSRQYPSDEIGAFEGFTAIAFHHFVREKPQVVIAEAGIGGRYDSTRIIPGSLTALTSLDFEHTKILGNTLELIAFEKLDLCPEYGTVVTGNIGDAELLRRVEAYCDLRHINLINAYQLSRLSRVDYQETRMIVDIQIDEMQFDSLGIGLLGRHQAINAATAILLVREWLKDNVPNIPSNRFVDSVRRGLVSVKWPGRLQKIHTNPDFYIDGGHSPAAIDAMVDAVRDILGDKPVLLVVGVSADKEVEMIVSKLLAVAAVVICTRAHKKGSPVSQISEIVRQQNADLPRFREETVGGAVQLAKEIASENNMAVLVAGGLFLSIEAMQVLKGKNPLNLKFF